MENNDNDITVNEQHLIEAATDLAETESKVKDLHEESVRNVSDAAIKNGDYDVPIEQETVTEKEAMHLNDERVMCNIKMDTDTSEPGPSTQFQEKKRLTNMVVSPSDTEEIIASSKKTNIELDKELKEKCILYITESFLNLCLAVKDDQAILTNISLGIQVGNMLFSVHRILRYEVANKYCALVDEARRQGFRFYYNGVHCTISLNTAKEIMTTAAKKHGLIYKAEGTGNWYNIVRPYINFMCSFGMRWNEIETGHSWMIHTKKGGEKGKFLVDRYGLDGCHHILLEGCTFPPEIRLSMAQNLGSMTVLLCYIRSGPKSADKWKAACKIHFGHIPYIDEILDQIRGKKASKIKSLINCFADVSTITTTGQVHRAYLPFNFVSVILWAGVKGGPMEKTPKKTIHINPNIALLTGNEHAKILDFHGHGAFIFYTAAVMGFNWTVKGEFSAVQAGQLVFHSIFGTYKADLGRLQQITDYKSKWEHRMNFDYAFMDADICELTTPIHKINYQWWSNLASGIQIQLPSTNYFQDPSIPSFSSRSNLASSKNSFDEMKKKQSNVIEGRSIDTLVSMLKDSTMSLIRDIKNNGMKLSAGTGGYFDVNNATMSDMGPCSYDKVFEGKGYLFRGLPFD